MVRGWAFSRTNAPSAWWSSTAAHSSNGSAPRCEQAGVNRVYVVTGYRHELVEATGVETIHSPDWATTNMVASLLRAMDALPPPYVISYSDIAYGPDIVRALLDAEGHLCLTYDTQWKDLWRRRFAEPTEDAESFSVDSTGLITDIGRRVVSIDEPQGQFMGLLRIDAVAANWIRSVAGSARSVATLDTTSLLQETIASGCAVRGVPVDGGWVEIDDADDLGVAEAMVADGSLVFTEAHT